MSLPEWQDLSRHLIKEAWIKTKEKMGQWFSLDIQLKCNSIETHLCNYSLISPIKVLNQHCNENIKYFKQRHNLNLERLVTILNNTNLVCHIQSIIIWRQPNICFLCPIRPEIKDKRIYRTKFRKGIKLEKENTTNSIYIYIRKLECCI